MITLKNLSLAIGNKVLLQDANLSLFEKQKIGLTGRNGCGKSTFLRLLRGEIHADLGECLINPQLRIASLAQELPDSNQSALQFVLAGDSAYMTLMSRLEKAEQAGDDAEVIAVHEAMTQMQAYRKPADAAVIMAGLGFAAEEQTKAVNAFSGGWRMRLNLARCLINPADLYLLDEPTNHLDLEAIVWLEKWLKQTPASLIIISHDRSFLDRITTHIVHIEHQKTTLYTGNFTQFEHARAQKLMLQQAVFEKQQAKIAHLMSFVNRFKAKATKARQAQSRLKAVERMPELMAAQIDSPFSFSFYEGKRVSNPLIQCRQVDAGYDAKHPILRRIEFSLQTGDRIALLGPNGQGKSTFIKTLTGVIAPLSGEVTHAANLNIGYYAQHQLDDLILNLSPVETIQRLTPEASEQTIRDFLGGFDFRGDMAKSPITHFSGGEKARLALAKLVWQKPNVLMLDEPTNHLDLDMRAALEIALQSYEGALVMISHDRHLLNNTVDNFYLIFNQAVRVFDGDLEDYQKSLVMPMSEQKKGTEPVRDYAERKRLQNQLKSLEKNMSTQQTQLQACETSLHADDIYDASQKDKLQVLLEQQEKLRASLSQTESDWLDVVEALERLSD